MAAFFLMACGNEKENVNTENSEVVDGVSTEQDSQIETEETQEPVIEDYTMFFTGDIMRQMDWMHC